MLSITELHYVTDAEVLVKAGKPIFQISAGHTCDTGTP